MKKNGFARLISLLLAACLMIGLMAGCGGGEGSGSGSGGNDTPANNDGGNEGGGTPATSDQTEFLISGGVGALSGGYDNNPVLAELASNVGVDIEWDLFSDSLGEKVGVMIGGDQLPDAFIAVGFSQYDMNRHGANGTFIDLTPYITSDIMPNLTKILEEHPEIKSAITNAEGKIYGLPSGELMNTSAIGADKDLSIYAIPEFSMINKKWLDELGLAVPTNLTELHDALKAFKDNDMASKVYGNTQGTIPMSTGYDQWCWGQEIFYAGFGFTNFTSDVCFDLTVDPDGKVSFVSNTDAYRDAVTYFSDWYKEGLLDLEMFSQDTSTLIAKVSQGRVGVTTWWYIDEIAGPYASDFVFLPPLKGPVGTQYENTCNVNLRSGPGVTAGQFSITKECTNPTLLCKYMDQWFSAETVMQLMYGPIGTYFTEKDENGVWGVITEEESQEKYGKSSGELKAQWEVYGPRLVLPEYYGSVFQLEDRAATRMKDLMENWIPYVTNFNSYPNDCTFTEDELDTIDRYKPDFTSQVSEYEGNWLQKGGPTDDEWNAYLQTLNDCGMEKLLEVYQAAYDRYQAAQ